METKAKGMITEAKSMVTEAEWSSFCTELDYLENIYDLLILLFLQIDGSKKPLYISEYYKTLNIITDEYWGDLTLLINELLMGVISFEFFISKFKNYISREKLRNIAIRMLFDFDIYFKNRKEYPALALTMETFSGRVYNFGPFNKVKSEYGLYLMPDCHYLKDFYKKNKIDIRFLEQSQFTVIDNKIKHYKIIKKDRLDRNIKIKYYEKMFQEADEYPELRIGIVPVSKTLWLKVAYSEYGQGEKNYFQLEEIEEYSKKINESYIKILKRCMEEDIQIVIFPELAMNKETEKTIREFLSKEKISNSNSLELVFMGSLWKNRMNEGILLSGTGTVLLRTQKIEAFTLKHRNKLYWEDLKEEAQEIQLLDIPGLGRIQYLVCKDALNYGLQHNMWGMFEIALLFISSYSNSISYFEKIGSSFCSQYAGIQVLSNACAPRLEIKHTAEDAKKIVSSPEIGHIMVPCRNDNKNTADFYREPYDEVDGCKSKCCFGGCIRVYNINPNNIDKDKVISVEFIKLI